MGPVRRGEWQNKKIEQKWDYVRKYCWSTLPGYIEPRKREDWIQYQKVLMYFG